MSSDEFTLPKNILIIYDTEITFTNLDSNLTEVHFEPNLYRNVNIENNFENNFGTCIFIDPNEYKKVYFPNVKKVILHFAPTQKELYDILLAFRNINYILLKCGYIGNTFTIIEDYMNIFCKDLKKVELFDIYERNVGKKLIQNGIEVNICIKI
jgi:hypothetical protein